MEASLTLTREDLCRFKPGSFYSSSAVSSTPQPTRSPNTAGANDVGKWEVEVHAGGVRVGRPTEATTAMPAAAEPFTTVNGWPSRYVSSWYFGNGATLINENLAALAALNPVFPRSGRITPLDPVLTGAAARSSDAGSFGFRVGRRLTSRFTAELNVDYAHSTLDLLESALNDIEASRATLCDAPLLRDLSLRIR